MEFYTEEQLKAASPEELTDILSRVNEEERTLQNSLVEVKTKLESKEGELMEIKSKVKETFGVDDIESLEKKKEEIVSEFMKVQKELQDILKENDGSD